MILHKFIKRLITVAVRASFCLSACGFTLNDVRYDVACSALAVSEEVTVSGQGSLRCRVSDHSRNGGRVYSCHLDLNTEPSILDTFKDICHDFTSLH